MNSCDDAVNILRYLDNELSGEELETFRAHLESCRICQVRLEEERTFSRFLHRTRPLYRAPEGLRHQVSQILKHFPGADDGAPRAYEGPLRILQRRLLNRWSHLPSWSVWTPALVAVSLCLIFVPRVVRRVTLRMRITSSSRRWQASPIFLEAGHSTEALSKTLGHSDIKITQRYYSHFTGKRQAALDADIERTQAAMASGH
jgi:hypothetical protein